MLLLPCPLGRTTIVRCVNRDSCPWICLPFRAGGTRTVSMTWASRSVSSSCWWRWKPTNDGHRVEAKDEDHVRFLLLIEPQFEFESLCPPMDFLEAHFSWSMACLSPMNNRWRRSCFASPCLSVVLIPTSSSVYSLRRNQCKSSLHAFGAQRLRACCLADVVRATRTLKFFFPFPLLALSGEITCKEYNCWATIGLNGMRNH